MTNFKDSLVGYKFLNPDQDAYSLSERALVLIDSVEEMQDSAGYWVKFKPIAGDYTKVIRNIIALESGTYGIIGYAASSRVSSFKF